MTYTFEKLKGFTPYTPVLPKRGVIANANESFLPPDPDISREIAQRAAQLAANRYPDPTAPGVREGFAAFYGVSPELVTVGNGSDELLSVMICGFLQKSDTVMTLLPDFSMYPFYAKLSGARHVTFEKNADLTFDPDALLERVRAERPKLLVLSNPCNPSSAGLRRDAMRRIVRECGCVIVADEAYMDFWDEKESLLGDVPEYENLIVLKTLSKVGYAAYRLGFAVTTPALTDLIRTVKSPYNVNALSQAAGECVFAHPDDLRARISAIRQSRDELYAGVLELTRKFPGRLKTPESRANFVTLLTEKPEKLLAFLNEREIYVSLNAGRYLRMTCCAPEDNRRLLTALDQYFQREEATK